MNHFMLLLATKIFDPNFHLSIFIFKLHTYMILVLIYFELEYMVCS
jgi:hypothetical protein